MTTHRNYNGKHPKTAERDAAERLPLTLGVDPDTGQPAIGRGQPSIPPTPWETELMRLLVERDEEISRLQRELIRAKARLRLYMRGEA